MIRDLLGSGQAAIEADLVIIGGGTAGLLVATRLADRGFRTVVLESGGRRQSVDEHPLNMVVQTRSVYSGAAHGRFRCLGGTSTRWGGALIPFLRADFDVGGWPLSPTDVRDYVTEVEKLFGLSPHSYDDLELACGSQFIARRAKWPSFTRRNMANLLLPQLADADGPYVWLNATVTRFVMTESGRLQHVVAEACDKSTITVRATDFVVAAGCIESTRLLLLADRQNRERLFMPDNVLGRYFHDHLSAMVATIDPTDRVALNRVAGFSFEHGGSMRNLRFELSDNVRRGRNNIACFAHIAFEERAGFGALRDVFRRLQRRSAPGLEALIELVRALPWLSRALWWRFYEHRLLYPPDSEIQVHIVIEQRQRAENRILLSADRCDIFGQPLAVIDWSIDAEDECNLVKVTDAFAQMWAATDWAILGAMRRRPTSEAVAELKHGGGIYHPAGTIRMARTPADGVVNSHLTTFRVPNLHVISTAVFPALGGASPTMMLLILALRLCDHLARRTCGQAAAA